MKKLLLILIMMPMLASAQVAEIVHYGNIAKDSTFTFVTTGHGYNSFFIVTDTIYGGDGVDFDAAIEILQGFDTLSPARVENGLITLSDTVNSERLIKGY